MLSEGARALRPAFSETPMLGQAPLQSSPWLAASAARRTPRDHGFGPLGGGVREKTM